MDNDTGDANEEYPMRKALPFFAILLLVLLVLLLLLQPRDEESITSGSGTIGELGQNENEGADIKESAEEAAEKEDDAHEAGNNERNASDECSSTEPEKSTPSRIETFTLRGRVSRYWSNDPIPGAVVKLNRIALWDTLPAQGVKSNLIKTIKLAGESRARTDDEGYYEIRNIPIGRYKASATADGFSRATGKIEGNSGEKVDHEFSLRRTYTISGRVLEEGSKLPIPGMTVVVLSCLGHTNVIGIRPGAPKVITDETGRFSISSALPFPMAKRTVKKDGTSSWVVGGSDVAYLGVYKDGWLSSNPNQIPVDGINFNVEDIEIYAKKSSQVSGRIINQKGMGVAGAKISVFCPEQDGFWMFGFQKSKSSGTTVISPIDFGKAVRNGAPPGPIVSDHQGRFKRYLPPDVKLFLIVSHPSYAFEYYEIPRSSPGVAHQNVIVKLSEGGLVKAIALDKDNRALSNKYVWYGYRGHSEQEYSEVWRSLPSSYYKDGSIRTDTKGRFFIGNLRPGEWRFSIRFNHTDLSIYKDVFVQVGQATSLELRLPEPLSIEGFILDEDANPIAGAYLQAFKQGQSNVGGGMSEGDGTFKVRGLIAGKYRLRVSKQGYKSKSSDEIEAGTSGLKIVLKRGN